MKEGMKKRGLVIFIISIIILTNFTGVWANTGDNLTTELKEHLLPLKTTLAESGLEDLMPLKNILKDKRILAMGEATHGTAEFFQMKHRMFEFLVKEMGYRAFGIEAEFGSSKIINEYILGKGGNIGRCLDAMKMWTWHTEEVADMIIWMKEYNENVNDDKKIRFYGFDMQLIDNSLLYIFDYLKEVGSHPPGVYTNNLKYLWINQLDPIKKGKTDEFKEDIDKIHNEIIENKDKYVKNSSIEEYDLILRHIEVIYQYLDHVKYPPSIEAFNKRDHYMAENVNWILDYESKYYGNEKIMLWAHNAHISNESDIYVVMGNNLKNFHGDDYYSIGFDFYRGDFVATTSPIFNILGGGKLSNFHINSTPKGSFAHQMMKTGIPISFLDIHSAKDNKTLSDFVSKKMHVNYIGAAYPGKIYVVGKGSEQILKDIFDGIIFVESTSAATRFTKGRELPNGNKHVMMNYVLNIIMVAIGLIGLVISIIKMVKNSKTKKEGKYYIFNKDDESRVGKKGIKRLIIKINDYFNSIPTVKYSAFIILSITILNIILSKVNSINIYPGLRNSNIMLFTIQTSELFFMSVAKFYIYFILPLKIVNLKLSDKFTNLTNITIAASIGTVIFTFKYLHLGIGLYALNLLLTLIKGIIYCYSYELFYFRDRKPIYNFIPIIFFHNILIILFHI